MADILFDPEEKGIAAALENKSVIVGRDTQVEARVKALKLKPEDHGTATRVRAPNGDLDKFRHLFGPKRRGR